MVLLQSSAFDDIDQYKTLLHLRFLKQLLHTIKSHDSVNLAHHFYQGSKSDPA
jgi:hypothetical protein